MKLSLMNIPDLYHFPCRNYVQSSVACVGQSLIPKDKAYLVEFEHHHNDPSLCWKTCNVAYPNASLGLISEMNDLPKLETGK